MAAQKATLSVIERYEAECRANAQRNLIHDLRIGRINDDAEIRLAKEYRAGRMHPDVVPHFEAFQTARNAARKEIFDALMSSASRSASVMAPKRGKAAARS